MNIHGFLNNWLVRWVKAAVAAASNTDSNSARIDMQDYESATFIVPITDSVAGGVATLTVEQNDDDADAGMAAVTGAVATATSAINDDLNDKVLVVEVIDPAKRYLQGVITSATQNIAFGDMTVILKPWQAPAVQGATVAASTIVNL